MALHLSHSLPTFRLNFSGDDFNEYRLRQGRVEFRASSGEWRILGEDEVQLHCLHYRAKYPYITPELNCTFQARSD